MEIPCQRKKMKRENCTSHIADFIGKIKKTTDGIVEG